jgi:hypothetical protein
VDFDWPRYGWSGNRCRNVDRQIIGRIDKRLSPAHACSVWLLGRFLGRIFRLKRHLHFCLVRFFRSLDLNFRVGWYLGELDRFVWNFHAASFESSVAALQSPRGRL